jgi:hypothetical protein
MLSLGRIKNEEERVVEEIDEFLKREHRVVKLQAFMLYHNQMDYLTFDNYKNRQVIMHIHSTYSYTIK